MRLRGCASETILQRIAKAPGHLYIILHNIEGSGVCTQTDVVNALSQCNQSWVSILAIVSAALRSSEAQGLLAELASMPNISLAASMDHVNTPLLWDKQMAARFDWLYFDVTNYTPYYFETANVPSLLVGRRQVSVCFHAVTLMSTCPLP